VVRLDCADSVASRPGQYGDAEIITGAERTPNKRHVHSARVPGRGSRPARSSRLLVSVFNMAR
jgi:hypothetical protein